MSDEYIEQTDEIPSTVTRTSKDSKVVVSSDTGLYEYRPPVGLNVKLVKSDMNTRVMRSATKKANSTNAESQSVFIKAEPSDEDPMDYGECIDVLYDIEPNYEYTTVETVELKSESTRKVSLSKSDDASTANDDSKVMQIKPVRTNKVRLGYTSSNKGKSTSTTTKGKASESATKENSTTNRSPKSKTNAKGEPKQPKKCEICGNTYMYQHALERYIQFLLKP